MKEKSRWFSSLRDLTRKLKVLSCKNKNTKVPFDYTIYDYSVFKKFHSTDYENGPHQAIRRGIGI